LSTNLTAIRASLYSTIEALAPKGPLQSRKTFRKAAQSFDAENRPASDVDREVTITSLRSDAVSTFGRVTGYECSCTLEIVVGHTKSGNLDESSARRDRDLHRICIALQKPANYPTDVWMIRFAGSSTEDIEDRWFTTLSFDLQANLETD
jgi:hypothetical protein